MNRLTRFCSLFLLGLTLTLVSFATVKLPAIVSSNMVLQRNTSITLWGWADAGEKISIDASWLSNPLSITADKEGNWKVEVKTTNSKAPQSIKINSNESDILLENILFGEVWLCSGQSNMTQPIKGYVGQPTFGTLQAMAGAKNENLRLFTVELNATMEPLKDVEKYRGWQSANMESVKNFSAIAYYFGKQLQETLDVPVGMIHTSWGGSLVEAWISNDVLEKMQEVDLSEVNLKRGNRFPTVLYNAMINPLMPYTIKGGLFYQGESNAAEPKKYTKLFPAMVKDWRDRWGIGDFPFYYAQIAPYIYSGNDAFADADNTAFIREAQLQCLDLIPNSGIAITMDIGKINRIHPPKKKEVAERLLYNALNQTYGIEAMDYSGPLYDSFEITVEGMLLKFKHAEMGLFAHDKLENFEIAGADKVFYPAIAQISGGRNVLVKSDQVAEPVAVRYAWRNWVKGTLYDTNLLPASSFRTDDWDDATLFKK